jgi:hypothetical protein
MTRVNTTQDFLARMERKYELKIAMHKAMFDMDNFDSMKRIRRANRIQRALKHERQRYAD